MPHVLLSRSIIDAPHIHTVLKHYIHKNARVVVFMYSFFSRFLSEKDYHDYYQEDGVYQLKIRTLFSVYGITSMTFISYYDHNHSKKIEAIQKADILYFPGGAPDEMMKRFFEHNLVETLQQFKGLTIGSSAGAMIHLKQYHIYKDKEYSKFSIQEGLGYIEGFDIVVHYRRRIQQKKAMRKLSKQSKLPIYTIDDRSALLIHNNTIICIGNARLHINAKGHYV